MRALWFFAIAMVIAGAGLMLGSVLAGIGPIALLGGVLLVWSGIVKVIVLRVWRTTLESAPSPEPALTAHRR